MKRYTAPMNNRDTGKLILTLSPLTIFCGIGFCALDDIVCLVYGIILLLFSVGSIVLGIYLLRKHKKEEKELQQYRELMKKQKNSR